MTVLPKIRAACRGESEALSDLALRSKAFWGYSNEFLEACREELTVDASRMPEDGYQCFVAEDNDTVIGFYTLNTTSDEVCELQALFVEPEHIGSGVGRLLLRHAMRLLSQRGVRRLTIQGDPNTTRFYLAAGAIQIGERESGSIPRRFLPVFEIDLANT